jgi:preprotein translocase subunit SecG
MTTALVVLHIFVCFFLIFIVLIQGGKGAELGAAFGGGSSQTVFGGRGAATFLNKMTTVMAVVFMLTSLILAIVSTKGGSVVRQSAPAKSAPAQPSEPGAPPIGGPAAPEIPQQEPIAPAPPPPAQQ